MSSLSRSFTVFQSNNLAPWRTGLCLGSSLVALSASLACGASDGGLLTELTGGGPDAAANVGQTQASDGSGARQGEAGGDGEPADGPDEAGGKLAPRAIGDRVAVSWNMQGESAGMGGVPESRWVTQIQQMLDVDGVQVVALQEAGNAPPPTASMTDRRFPMPGVTEFLWNMGTGTRPNLVNIYFADTGQQRNGLAIVTRETVTNAVQLPVTSRFNSRPMMGVQIGSSWYFTAHALSNGPTSANDAEDIIETARQFIASNAPADDWMVIADFNRSPGQLPLRLQRNIVAAGQPTQQGGNELDFAYTNAGNNNTFNAEVRAANSDHAYVRYSLGGCGAGSGPAARADASSKCAAPVPGETYRFFSRHLENAVIGDGDGDGAVDPSARAATGGDDEAITVRFSSQPGQYHLALSDGRCLARVPDSNFVTTLPCFDLSEVQLWQFLDGQIFAPGLAGALQPSVNQLGTSLVVATGIYQWRPEPFSPSVTPPEPSPGASPSLPAPGANFSQSCSSVNLVGADRASWAAGAKVELHASCPNDAGVASVSRIILSDLVGNADGALTWGSAGFERSCGWANPDGPEPGLRHEPAGIFLRTLHCQGRGRDTCPDDGHPCELNLDQCIANRNGNLTYICL